MYYGDERPKAKVHKDFKCIVIIDDDSRSYFDQERELELSISNSQKEEHVKNNLILENKELNLKKSGEIEIKQPAPFLNRFEKYRLKIVDVLSEQQCENLIEVLNAAMVISNGLESRFVGMNIEMISSIVVRREDVADQENNYNPFDEKNEHISKEKYMKFLNKLTTSNYLLSQGDQMSQKKVLEFKNAHPYSSLTDLMETYDENYNVLRKNSVYTFSSTFSLDQAINDFRDLGNEQSLKIDRWEILTSFDLVKSGTANRKNIIEEILNSKKHILI